MKAWAVQDAKARFSKFLDACLSEGPQLVTRRGMDAAVLVPAAQWQRMQSNSRATLKDLLFCDEARTEALAPERTPARGNARRRPMVALD